MRNVLPVDLVLTFFNPSVFLTTFLATAMVLLLLTFGGVNFGFLSNLAGVDSHCLISEVTL